MKLKFTTFALAVTLLFGACQKETQLQPQDNGMFKAGGSNTIPNNFCSIDTVPLYAGGGNTAAAKHVGNVFLSSNGVTLIAKYVLYKTVPQVFLNSVHLSVGDELKDIPVTQQGNPVPGQFAYKASFSKTALKTEYQFSVPLATVGTNYIAAHASVTTYGGLFGLEANLPNNQVTLTVVDYPSPGDPSYFKIQLSNSGFMDGIYNGWCVDADNPIRLNYSYKARLYTSYETLPAGMFEHPENFDLVNYLVNHYAAGQQLQVGTNADGSPIYEAITYGDIQRSIWALIDDNLPTSGLGTWSQTRVNIILTNVYANGNDFTPGCDDYVAIVSLPVANFDTNLTNNVQIVIGQGIILNTPISCTDSKDTAWGDGKTGAKFPAAKQWGTYFTYKSSCN